MITSEGNDKYDEFIERGEGYSNTVEKNGNGGAFVRQNIYTGYMHDGGTTSKQVVSYNVGFGSTMPTAAWVEWSAAQYAQAGLSTESFSDDPKERQVVEINVPASNLWTVHAYGDLSHGSRIAGAARRGAKFEELYEKGDERKARHKKLREQGLTPPFPRADRFYQNKHQQYVRAGVTTEGSY